MKTPSFFRKTAGITLGLCFSSAAVFCPAAAQEVTKAQIQQNKADEQVVRANTAAVVNQVQNLIDELGANGISGDDIKVLNATKAALTHLSGPEMDRVIASLQKAGDSTTAAASQQNVVNAYAGQKGIILQFKQILKDYEQRQAAYELPVRFKELAARQTETMLTAAGVARATAGKSASELTSMQQTTQQIVQADQEAIGNEVALAQEQLNKAAANSTTDDTKSIQKAQTNMKNGALSQALQQANDALKAGQLLKALKAQAVARDELKKIAQDLNPATNAVDALAATAASLAKVIEEQKALLQQTNAATNVKPRVTGLDEKQGAIVDETNSLQQDMQSLSPTQAGLVKEAINPMQLSRAALGSQWGGPDSFAKAATSQQAAIDKLEDAQKQMQQQLADAKKAADDASKDTVAKLQDVQKQIQNAQQQQQQVNNQTAQAQNNQDKSATSAAQQQQQQLQQQVNALQQSTQPLSLDAAKDLANAADKMNQAQQDLNDPNKAADAQTAQKAAQDALAQAQQQVAQQIAQAQQQAADPAALAAAANSLQKAQDSVSTALSDATPPGTPPAGATPPPPSMAAAAAALDAAAKDTQAAANTPGLPSSAAAAVADAKADIGKGQAAAAKGDAAATAAAATAAQNALAQAQASVAMAQSGMAAAGAPQPPGPPAPGQGPPMPGQGPPMPGQQPGKPGQDSAKSLAGGSTDKGSMHDVSGSGKFVTVASRDRAAIEQTQSEKRPQEYAPMIDQYMKNLADQSSAAP